MTVIFMIYIQWPLNTGLTVHDLMFYRFYETKAAVHEALCGKYRKHLTDLRLFPLNS